MCLLPQLFSFYLPCTCTLMLALTQFHYTLCCPLQSMRSRFASSSFDRMHARAIVLLSRGSFLTHGDLCNAHQPLGPLLAQGLVCAHRKRVKKIEEKKEKGRGRGELSPRSGAEKEKFRAGEKWWKRSSRAPNTYNDPLRRFPGRRVQHLEVSMRDRAGSLFATFRSR